MTAEPRHCENRRALRLALMEAGYFGLASTLLRRMRKPCMPEKQPPPPPSMDAAA